MTTSEDGYTTTTNDMPRMATNLNGVRRGGRYDSWGDQSPSLEPLGPQVFSRAIRTTPFLARF
jgi:hypothetical protein